jgi:hypothetical protein
VDQGSRLECLAGRLVRQPLGRQLAQLVIHQGQQLLRRLLLAALDRRQNLRNIAHRQAV